MLDRSVETPDAVTPAGLRGDVRVDAGACMMKVQHIDETVAVSGLDGLDASNSVQFRDQVRASMQSAQRFIEIDLSSTTFLDSNGLGALIALHKTTCSRNGMVRLVNPTPPIQQILELTRMHRIFEVVKR